MKPELIEHLVKVDEHQTSDFRWYNIRILIKKFIEGKRILDAGCGTGHLSLDLLKEGYEVISVDYSHELVNFAKMKISQYFSDPQVFACDLTTLNTTNYSSFDTIISLDVIEHVERDDIILQKFFELLHSGGTLIISVPAVKSLYGERDKNVGHFRRYDKRDILEKLIGAGFTVVHIQFWNFISIIPYIFFEKILKMPIDEDIRYSKTSKKARLYSLILCDWFFFFENHIKWPIGLTLIVVCKKMNY